MSTLPTPNEFKIFARFFHQDAPIIFRNEGEIIAGALRAVGSEGKAALQTFIGELASGSLSEQELKQIWLQTNSEVGLGGPYLAFFRRVQEIMSKAQQ